MSYNISSDKFQHPLLKPILVKLTEYFSKEQIHFYLIGATARDIIMQIHDERSSRATHDLDIAIAIANWDEFKKVEEGIVRIDGFTKDSHQKQRFLYEDTFFIDIVPFGDVLAQGDKIFWPPNEEVAMSILGFQEVRNITKELSIDDELIIQIASLDGIFLLKIVAWSERHIEGNKDADDIAFIFNNYLLINEEIAIDNHYDLYQADDFDTTTTGARLLGRDLNTILKHHPDTKSKIQEIIDTQIELEEESPLIKQILETHRSYSYELAIQCLIQVVRGLSEDYK